MPGPGHGPPHRRLADRRDDSTDNGSHGNIEWFEKKGDVALACLLWAAAVSGHTITDVFNWAQLFGHEDALQVLATHPDSTPQMLAVVKRMLADNRTSGSVRDTIELSLSWAIIPTLAAAVTPPPGQGFDLARFISQNGTLYLIASGDEDSPVTPLFRAFTSYVHYAAGLMGTLAPAGRLDPPLRMALDEVTTICPVDLPTMLSDSAGKGVLITAVAHGTSQLKERWGEYGGQTVWDTCGTKILLGGISDAETLRQASADVRDSDPRRARRAAACPGRPAGTHPCAAGLAGAGYPDEPLPGRGEDPAGLEAAGSPPGASSRLMTRAGRHERKPPIGTTPCRWSFRSSPPSCPRTGLPMPGRSPLRTGPGAEVRTDMSRSCVTQTRQGGSGEP